MSLDGGASRYATISKGPTKHNYPTITISPPLIVIVVVLEKNLLNNFKRLKYIKHLYESLMVASISKINFSQHNFYLH